MRDEILDNIRQSLAAITVPRFYETERGFQGELLVQLRQRAVLPDQIIIEQEHQKVARTHGLVCRPDIIVHEPFDEGQHHDRAQGNYGVIELKRRAGTRKAQEDFDSIANMIRVLRYPLGVFINIDASKTHAKLIPEDLRTRISSFAVALRGGAVQIFEA